MFTTRATTLARSFAMRRRAFPHALVGAGMGLSLGSVMVVRQQPAARMDSHVVPRSGESAVSRRETLDPDVLRQLSGGSISGFLSGLLISTFSRTLVLLLGIVVVVGQVAARYGIHIVDQLRVKQRLEDSRVLAALQRNPAFKLSFGLFFAMSAFMKFEQ